MTRPSSAPRGSFRGPGAGQKTPMNGVARTVLAGLAAGAAGTAAMTLSSTIEMKLSGRGPSTVPAEALEKVTGAEIPDEEKGKVANAVHYATGLMLGLARGVWDRIVPCPEPLGSAAFLPVAWSPELVGEPALR